MRIALAHDYLTQRGGAERVVAAWLDAWPDAPLYTTLFEPSSTFERFSEADVRTSWLNHVAALREHHRRAFPLLAPTVGAWHIDADVVLASSSGWAHGLTSSGRVVVYCHAPARWLYQSDRYLARDELGSRAKWAQRALAPALTRWDQRAARRADQYVANSSFTRSLIRDVYDRDAEIVFPPVTAPPNEIDNEDRSDVLVVARLLPYKNVDLAIQVATRLPDVRFRIVGDGPLFEALTSTAPNNVTFTGALEDHDLWVEYASTKLHLALSHEDFGITPLEAAASGRPTLARRSGGYLDTITERTGVLVDEDALDPDSLARALEATLARRFDESALRQHAGRFSVTAHNEALAHVAGIIA